MSQFLSYAKPDTPRPVDAASLYDSSVAWGRLQSLDLLRGFAILGILLMNTQSMAMPSWAYFDPTYYGTPDRLNYFTWAVIHVLADVKLLTIFSMLFGAGIIIQADRVAARGQVPAAVHYRRMLALLLIGLIHAYLIWFGDVLVAYVVCGMLLFPIRKLPPRLLLVMGVLCISMVVWIRYVDELNASPLIEKLNRTQERIYGDTLGLERELEIYRSGWWAQIDNRVRLSLANQTTWFVLWGFWRYAGSMLIGMALLRMRFFHGDWPRESYWLLAWGLIPLGWCITVAGILFNESHSWNVDMLFFHGETFNFFGSLITAIGYLAAGVLIAMQIGPRVQSMVNILTWPIRAVGRTALSNYILQGLICTTLFYGHGFGWFGHLNRIELVGVVLSIWAFQLLISTLWLAIFVQGPLEWAWHWLAHGRANAQA